MSYKEIFLPNDLIESDISLEGIVLYAHIIQQIELDRRSYEYDYVEKENKDEDGCYTIIPNQELKDVLRIKSNNTLTKVKRELEERNMLMQKRTLDGSNKYYIIG